MINLSNEFYNNTYNDKNKYIELYQQSGYSTHLTGSSKEDYKETTLNGEGMSLRIISNNYRKFISTPKVERTMLEILFEKLKNYDRNISLTSNSFIELMENIPCGYLKELYISIDTIFKKYNLHHITNIQINNLSKYIYKNNSQNIAIKKDTNIYLFITYCIKNKEHTLFDVISNKSNKLILSNIEKNILNYINSEKDKIISPGKYDVILASGTASVLVHECCGHLFEASKTASPFYNIDKNVILASPKLTVIDDTFHLSRELYDDEAEKKEKTYIIKSGRFESLLTDHYTSFQSNRFKSTGNCRRQSYLNFPEPRMYCTYIEKGNDCLEKIFSTVNNGIFIKSLRESYINHKSGDFQSLVEEGYIIKNSKIKNPIYNIKIKDNVKTFLQNIKYISDDLKIVPGMCNSNSGLLYVEYGSPTMYVKNINLSY